MPGSGLPMLPDFGRSIGLSDSHAAFGEAVAFDQRHADGRVEFGQILAQRRGSGGRDAQAAAQARANFREHQASAILSGARHPFRNGLAFLAQAGDFGAHPTRRRTAFAGDRALFLDFGLDAGEDALPHARRRE